MKTSLKYFIGLLLLVLTIIGLYNFFVKNDSKISNALKPIYIPDISLKTMDDQMFPLNTKTNKYKFLFFFDSNCDHCQAEASLLQKHLSEFKEANLIFISSENLRNIRIFADDYHLKNQPNITLCQIDPDILTKYFGYMGFPTIFVYNPQNQFVKKYSGEIDLELLTEYLK